MRQFLIPSGHCFESEPEPKWIYVKVTHKENILDVSKVIHHPLFNGTVMTPYPYDIAILKLATPIKTTHFFVCLPTNDLDLFMGITATTSGWGITRPEEEVPSNVKTKIELNFALFLSLFLFLMTCINRSPQL